MAHARAHIGTLDYAVNITARSHSLTADEPPTLGGADAGMAPYDLLLASLGACTAITLRMYAKRKEWPLQFVDVDLRFSREDDHARIDRRITMGGPISPEQMQRLLEIAEKTPVTLTLKSGTQILTTGQHA